MNKQYNKWLQYAITVALNNEEIEKYPERIGRIKPYIDKYNCRNKLPIRKKW